MTGARLSTKAPPESFDEQARGAHALVGTVLLGSGAAAVVAAAVLGVVVEADLCFLTCTDIAVIGTAMVAVGVWLRVGLDAAADQAGPQTAEEMS